jgi:hypothetical protein
VLVNNAGYLAAGYRRQGRQRTTCSRSTRSKCSAPSAVTHAMFPARQAPGPPVIVNFSSTPGPPWPLTARPSWPPAGPATKIPLACRSVMASVPAQKPEHRRVSLIIGLQRRRAHRDHDRAGQVGTHDDQLCRGADRRRLRQRWGCAGRAPAARRRPRGGNRCQAGHAVPRRHRIGFLVIAPHLSSMSAMRAPHPLATRRGSFPRSFGGPGRRADLSPASAAEPGPS